mgnify:CR=1 FL=1
MYFKTPKLPNKAVYIVYPCGIPALCGTNMAQNKSEKLHFQVPYQSVHIYLNVILQIDVQS